MKTKIYVLLFLWGFAFAGLANAKVSLTAENDAALCFKCHSDMEQKAQAENLHGPLKNKNCSSCHNPHTAKFAKLIVKQDKDLCLDCHEDKFGDKAMPSNVHSPVKEGKCLVCHDPHGSANKGLLARPEKELCMSCHQDLVDEKHVFKHSLFQEGKCTTCHDPHGSNYTYDLVKEPKALCISCHKTTDAKVKAAHGAFDIAKSACTPCHTGHASSHKGLINEYAHSAVVDNKCDTCHNTKGADPTRTLRKGADLCYACHTDKKEEFKVGNVHPLVAKGDCVGCHDPHASNIKGMPKARERDMCLNCHTYIKEDNKSYPFTHNQKVEKGKCTICHAAHNSTEPKLLAHNPEMVCRTCHGGTNAGMKFGHPSGPGVLDPRDRDKQTIVTCITCHAPHGTFYVFALKASGEQDLCLECHKLEK